MWHRVLIINSLLNIGKSDITTKTISTHYVLFCLFPNRQILHAWKCESQSNWLFGGTSTGTMCFRISCPREGGSQAVRHGKFLGAGVTYTWGLHEQCIAKIHSSRSGMKNNRDQALLANQKSRYIKDILYAYCLGLEEKCSRLAHFCTDITRRALQCIVSRFSEV